MLTAYIYSKDPLDSANGKWDYGFSKFGYSYCNFFDIKDIVQPFNKALS